MWLLNARMFIGDFQCDMKNEGKLYELQLDNTYALYQVKYDPHRDIKEGKNVHK